MARILSLVSIFLFVLCLAGTAFGQNANSPRVVSAEEYSAVLNSPDWVRVDNVETEDPAVQRIFTSIGFDLLYTGTVVGFTFVSLAASLDADGAATTAAVLFSLGATLAPALAVHTSHAIWGGDGSIGWTYGGAFIGGAVGLGIVALASEFGNNQEEEDEYKREPFDGLDEAIGLAFVIPACALLGALLGYEISNSVNRKARMNSYFSVSKIYPTFEVTKERQTVGLALEF